MEGGDPDRAGVAQRVGRRELIYEFDDALTHLTRGFIREGNGQDLVGLRSSRGQEVGDPPGQHASLS